jgi:hypothetical protein
MGTPLPVAMWRRTDEVETAIRRDIDVIRTFWEDAEAVLLIVLPSL